ELVGGRLPIVHARYSPSLPSNVWRLVIHHRRALVRLSPNYIRKSLETSAPRCDDGLMPNIDPGAKAWQEIRSQTFGRAVADRRNALGLTASQLALRTKPLGYPMTRSTI